MTRYASLGRAFRVSACRPNADMEYMRVLTPPDLPAAAQAPPCATESPDVLELGQFIPCVYHFNMLADDVRMGAFKEAIALTVLPGHKVLELGGGTGVLSHFASLQGASVVCVERNPEMVEQARQILRANGSGNRVHVVQADAMDFLPATPVDIVICEMIHVGMLREKQLLVIDSFKRRYLDKFGPPLPRFIPEAFFQAVQPVQQRFDYHGYVAATPSFQDPMVVQPRTRTLSLATLYQAHTYEDNYPLDCSWSGELSFIDAGEFNALRLITKNVLAVIPEQQRAVEWTSQYLIVPLREPLNVEVGQTATVRFSYRAGDPIAALQPEVVLMPRKSP